MSTNNIGSQVPLTLHPNFPTLSLRKTSSVPRPVSANLLDDIRKHDAYQKNEAIRSSGKRKLSGY